MPTLSAHVWYWFHVILTDVAGILLITLLSPALVFDALVFKRGVPKAWIWWGRIMAVVSGGLQVTVKNRHLAAPGHPPAVYVCNHQSQYDMIPQSLSFPDRAVIVGKRSLLFVPVFGFLFWVTGNILVDRKNPESAKASLKAAAQTLKPKNLSVWIYPEGTRNRKGGLLPFKKGAFHLARDAGVPIIPVIISPYTGKNGWYNKPERAWKYGGKVSVTYLDPIPTDGVSEEKLDELIEKVRGVMLAHLEKEEANSKSD